MLKHLKTLCELSGVSSFESPVRKYIEKCAIRCGASVRTDALGNLIAFKKGKKKGSRTLMLAAHMDEVGFMITKIEDGGFARFAPVGGIDRRVVPGRHVLVGEKQLHGLIGLKPIHLTTDEEEKKAPEFKDLYIDLGAKDKAEAETLVRPGDCVVFASRFERFGRGMVKAKAIDDRFGCAVMLQLLEEELPQDVTFAFTVQEEVGCRGAFGAAFSVRPDIALILEGTTSADIAGVEGPAKITCVGKGPVFGYLDGSTIYDRGLFELLRGEADSLGIPWQIKSRIAGGTDARAVQRSREGVRVANISAPVRYLHSAATVASLKDMDNGYRLAKRFLEVVASGKAGK